MNFFKNYFAAGLLTFQNDSNETMEHISNAAEDTEEIEGRLRNFLIFYRKSHLCSLAVAIEETLSN